MMYGNARSVINKLTTSIIPRYIAFFRTGLNETSSFVRRLIMDSIVHHQTRVDDIGLVPRHYLIDCGRGDFGFEAKFLN